MAAGSGFHDRRRTEELKQRAPKLTILRTCYTEDFELRVPLHRAKSILRQASSHHQAMLGRFSSTLDRFL